MPTPIAIPDIPYDFVAAQAAVVMGPLWALLAVILGIVLGVFAFRRIRGAIARRM